MSLLLGGAIFITALIRSFQPRALAIERLLMPTSIFAVLYVLWIALEARVAVTEPRKGSSKSDKISLEFYAISQAVTVLSALWLGSNSFTIAHVFGLTFLTAGVTTRLWAVRTLGQYYSHVVRIQKNQPVVKTGPYRFIRHPAYVGMIVAHLGVVVALANPVTVFVFVLGLLPAILLRIRIEEKVLFSLPEYTEFARTRKRLLPMIW